MDLVQVTLSVSCAHPSLVVGYQNAPHSPVHALQKSHERVRASLASRQQQQQSEDGGQGQGKTQTRPPSPTDGVDVSSWSASQLTGAEGLDPSKAWSFKDFEKRLQSGEPARSAFPAPSSLPPLPSGIEAGPFPRLEEVLSRVGR